MSLTSIFKGEMSKLCVLLFPSVSLTTEALQIMCFALAFNIIYTPDDVLSLIMPIELKINVKVPLGHHKLQEAQKAATHNISSEL